MSGVKRNEAHSLTKHSAQSLRQIARRRQALGVTVLGFTLLEVMISVAILAMGLSSVFGSNVIAARRVAHARMVTQAALLGQCRMTAVESYLRKNQLPQTDQTLDDPPATGAEVCCEAPFSCEAKVEKIELPNPPEVSSAAGNDLLSTAASAMAGSQFGASTGATGGANAAANPLAGLAGALGGLGGAAGGQPGSGAMSQGANVPNIAGIQAQLLSSIYPTLKPLLEGAIRKVTVRVVWNEGSRENSILLVQYVTNPGQTLQSGDTMPNLNNLGGALGGALGGGAGGAGGALGGLGGLLGGSSGGGTSTGGTTR
jgi:prepilin-type N-terminal cleavage/methylation domain-containing protein